jgi:2-dehydropantoate 2-reductase
MRILVFGAGPLGSLIAARLQEGGLAVTLLARGQRLEELKQYGLALKSWTNGAEEVYQIPLIDQLDADDVYDLILVVMRKNSALKTLPILAANRSKEILFLMNNAAGPQALTEALGEERVLIGFAGMAGYRDGARVVFLNAEEGRPGVIYLGEPGGGISARLEETAAILRQGKHLSAQIEPEMDAWSKYHVAMLFPGLAPALYLCGNDNYRMARTRDGLVLAWRAMLEGFRVLRKLGYPVRPAALKKFTWLPEPLAVPLLSKLMANPHMEVAMVRHAEVIRDEITQLNDEFMQLVEASGEFTPTMRFLINQYKNRAPALPDGSRSIRLHWSGVLIPVLLVICLGLMVGLIF